ncbi:hypothetical protein QY008_25060, partial [Klebsiella pneumoniae]|nr:hypothetical protein [Klebsiella pneumoniae]
LTGEDYWRGQTSTFLEQVKGLQEPLLWSNLNGHFDRVFSPRQGT